jgi:hypothetical protein
MSNSEYKLELTSVFDPNNDVTFKIEPPVRFLTEQARKTFGQNALRLIARRADYGELEGSCIELTHDSADGSATIGYARVPALRYGTGKEVFFQGLLLALNGRTPDLYDSDGTITYPKFD